MQRTLVIRFGSLGDLCVCSWMISGIADVMPDVRISLATKDGFARLAREIRGVQDVHSLTGSSPAALDDLSLRLREAGTWDRVIDAHDVLRSRILTWKMRRGPDSRLDKNTLSRLALLLRQRLRGGREGEFNGSPVSGPLSLRMLDRFDFLADDAFPQLSRPGADLIAAGGPPPLASLRPRHSSRPALGLAPGAQWNSKRWNPAKWAELLHGFRAVTDAPVRVFLGPREEWFRGSVLAAAVASLPGVEVLAGRSLVEVAAGLAGCGRVATNDSGLLHLAEAAGTPVTALFGPTVRAFGYFPLLPGSNVCEIPLACRPCSRNGKRRCHRGDQACLERIEPSAVLAAVLAGRDWNSAAEGSR